MVNDALNHCHGTITYHVALNNGLTIVSGFPALGRVLDSHYDPLLILQNVLWLILHCHDKILL